MSSPSENRPPPIERGPSSSAEPAGDTGFGEEADAGASQSATDVASPPPCMSDWACDDGERCTDDRCTSQGCVYDPVALGVPCEGGTECLDARCDGAGVCALSPTVGAACVGSSPCMVERQCDDDGVCGGGVPEVVGTACQDDDACTVQTTCQEDGSCGAGQPLPVPDEPCVACTCNAWRGIVCEPEAPSEDCPCGLFGRIRYVESFPDVTVRFVTTGADLEIREVSSWPDRPGEWEIVESFEDWRVKVVDSFPDIEVKLVEGSPDGCEAIEDLLP